MLAKTASAATKKLEPRPGPRKKLNFLSRRFPSQHRIAMRKPPKLRNHPLMPLGKVQIIGEQRPIDLRLLRHQFDVTRDTFIQHRKVSLCSNTK